MRTRGSLALAVFFLLIGLFGIVQSLTFRDWEAMTMPLIVSGLMFILAGVQVVRELRRQGHQKTAVETEADNQDKDKVNTSKIGLVFGWAAGFCLGVYLLGFYIAITVFAFSYLKWRGRSWLTAAIFAIAMLAFIYGVFVLGLKAPLYKGVIFGAR
jgi:hypothetical protein